MRCVFDSKMEHIVHCSVFFFSRNLSGLKYVRFTEVISIRFARQDSRNLNAADDLSVSVDGTQIFLFKHVQ